MIQTTGREHSAQRFVGADGGTGCVRLMMSVRGRVDGGAGDGPRQ